MRWSSAAGPRSLPGILGLMNGTTSCMTPSTNFRSWSRRLAPWTRLPRCRDGTFRMSLVRCADCWSLAWAGGETGVCAGAPAAGELQAGRGALGSEGHPSSGSVELRCRKAPGVVPTGGPAAPAGPGVVSLPAQDQGEHDLRRGLHEVVVVEGGMTGKPPYCWNTT